jgi:hypothetical protein
MLDPLNSSPRTPPREIHAVHTVRVAQVRWLAEQQSVDNAEHRGVRADPQSERDDDSGREARASADTADGIPKLVVEHIPSRAGRRRFHEAL